MVAFSKYIFLKPKYIADVLYMSQPGCDPCEIIWAIQPEHSLAILIDLNAIFNSHDELMARAFKSVQG